MIRYNSNTFHLLCYLLRIRVQIFTIERQMHWFRWWPQNIAELTPHDVSFVALVSSAIVFLWHEIHAVVRKLGMGHCWDNQGMKITEFDQVCGSQQPKDLQENVFNAKVKKEICSNTIKYQRCTAKKNHSSSPRFKESISGQTNSSWVWTLLGAALPLSKWP